MLKISKRVFNCVKINRYFCTNKSNNEKLEIIIEYSSSDSTKKHNSNNSKALESVTNNNDNIFKSNEILTYNDEGLCLISENKNSDLNFTKLFLIVSAFLSYYFGRKLVLRYKEKKRLRAFGNFMLFGISLSLLIFLYKFLKMQINTVYLQNCGKMVVLQNSNIFPFNTKIVEISSISKSNKLISKYFYSKYGFVFNINNKPHYISKNSTIYHKEILKNILLGNNIQTYFKKEIIIN